MSVFTDEVPSSKSIAKATEGVRVAEGAVGGSPVERVDV